MPRPITPSCVIYLPEEVGPIEIPSEYQVSGVATSHTGIVILQIINILREGERFISGFELRSRSRESQLKDTSLGLADLERIRSSSDKLPNDWQRFYFLFTGELLNDWSESCNKGEDDNKYAHFPYFFYDGTAWQCGIVSSAQKFGQLAKLLRIKNGQV
ncbi:MAG: hypothetical protein ABH822_02435 [Patescibacteria group bacterium]